ncbi:hypothetical protein ACFLZ7_01695 [Nanoarchaeota archaeon]
MAEDMDFKATRHSARIRFEGLADMEGLFQMIREWLHYRRFEVHEPAHKRKPMPRGFEHETTFYGERKESDYVMFIINVYVHSHFTEDVEIIENGVKKKIQKSGSMVIEIWPTLRLDWQNRWETSEFKKKLRKFFHDVIIKTYIEIIWWDRLYYITYKLHTKIKEFLNMQSHYNAYENMWQT